MIPHFEAIVDLLPPSFRQTIIEDSVFLSKFDIPVVTTITFGGQGPSFESEKYYEVLVTALNDIGCPKSITDDQKNDWEILVVNKDENLKFNLQSENERIKLSDYSALSANKEVRLDWILKTVEETYLSKNVFEYWLDRLSIAPLSAEEYQELVLKINNSASKFISGIRTELTQNNTIDRETLVPRDPEYYFQLVGSPKAVHTVEQYIQTAVIPLMADLQNWNNVEGFLNALLLCTTEKISRNICIDHLSKEELSNAYQWLEEHGDLFSLIAAVEVALSNFEHCPELVVFVDNCIKRLGETVEESDYGDINLLSALVFLVDSELSHLRVLGDVCPFYRRQAAIAHASLIFRALGGIRINYRTFFKWMEEIGHVSTFYLQGLVDLRLEPRWYPEFMQPEALRNEFIGRVRNAISRNTNRSYSESIRLKYALVEKSIDTLPYSLLQNLAGPLEGERVVGVFAPQEVLQKLNKDLEVERLNADSFIGVINSAFIYDLDTDQAQLVAKALRRVNYFIETTSSSSSLNAFLDGLAAVSAITRCSELADSIRTLHRVLRRRNKLPLRVDNELRLIITTAAAHENSCDWAEFAGNWITEIAFEIVDKEDADHYLLALSNLIKICPELTRYTTRASAALASLRDV